MLDSQKTKLSFGIGGIILFSYAYYYCNKKYQKYSLSLQEFEKLYQQQTYNNNNNKSLKLQQLKLKQQKQLKLKQQNQLKLEEQKQLTLEQYKQNTLPQKIIFQNVIPNLQKNTLKIFQHQRSLLLNDNKYPEWHKKIVAGNFKFISNNKQIQCCIKNTNIHHSILVENVQPISNIPQSTLKPIVANVTKQFITSTLFSIYGTIEYNQIEKKYILIPKFICQSSDLFQQVFLHYSNKKQRQHGKRAMLAATLLAIAYFLIYRPLKNYWGRDKIVPARSTWIKQLPCINVRKSGGLNCQYCHTFNLEMLYECGHLTYCQQCHNSLDIKRCPICRKQSHKFTKLYMA